MATSMSKRGHVPPPLQQDGESTQPYYERNHSSTSSSGVDSFNFEVEVTEQTTLSDSATRQETQSPQEQSALHNHNHSENGNAFLDSMMAGQTALPRRGLQTESPRRKQWREWKQWLSKAELLSGVLVPLIYVVAVLPHYPRHAGFPSRTTIEHLTNAIAFSSATLLSISGYASKLSRRNNGSQSEDLPKLDNMQVTLSTTLRAFGVLLPFFAASELGGVTVAFSLLLVASSDLGGLLSRVPDQSTLRTVWKYKFTLAMILLATLFHYAYLSPANEHSPSIWGYLALYASIFVLPSPILPLPPKLTLDFATSRFLIWGPPPIPPTSSGMPFASPLIKTSDEIEVSKTAGYALAAAWTILIVFLHGISRAWADGILTLGLGTVGIVVSALRARPEYLRTRRKKGVAAGCGFVAISGLFLNPGSWAVSFLFAGLVGLAYAATLFDGSDPIWRPSKKTNGKHDHAHDHSKLTGYLLSLTTPGYVLHTILLERDSRRIAYFGCLNLGFMVVQFFYGFATGSLGLLTDSIHMLFDCLGLGVGLAAAVMSKWPPSLSFPYGYGKMGTLAGFANGIFLILVSVEIVFDAIHRLEEGHELRRLNELLVVSSLGFLVNIVGLTAFGHAHHGHDHGHDHGHSHSRSDRHIRSHSHSHSNHLSARGRSRPSKSANRVTPSLPPTPFSIPASPIPLPPIPPTPHNHSNENMQGIFLHILADALGSVAVIFSTLLTKYNSWHGWDPLASCAIAILIFFSAIPLVKSSGKRLLLALPDEIEYEIRGVLQGIGQLRGVVGYAGVRFWIADAEGGGHGHDHGHGHSHQGHVHDHEHDNGYSHGHDHDHLTYTYTHDGLCKSPNTAEKKHRVLGNMHIIAARDACLVEVNKRVAYYLKTRGFEIVLHIEREGDKACWCGGKKP